MCELLHTSLRQIGSVFEMSHQSNFRNHAVVEKVGVSYRPRSSRVTPRGTQIPTSSPRPRCRGFFLIGPRAKPRKDGVKDDPQPPGNDEDRGPSGLGSKKKSRRSWRLEVRNREVSRKIGRAHV